MRIKTKIDTDAIAKELARDIQNWVQAADFFSLPASMPVPTRGADRFQYNLTIEDGNQKHGVVLYDSENLSEPLKLLLKQLMELARKNPSS